MPKFSVKKPYFILVAVLALIVLGITGFTRMTTDFLPDMELPYMVIMTPDPGASPQKAETEITDPMEDAVSTISGIKNVSSLSANNMSQVMLEFEHGTDMDGAMVKVTSAVNQLELPENAGKPIIMEISMDMMPVTYLSVDKKGYDSVKLTKYVEDSVIPTLKRQDGVASVQSAGMIKEQLQIKLNQHKVDQVNQRIHDKVAAEFDDAQADLDEASSKLDKAEKKLKKSKKKLKKQQKKTSKRMATYTKLMNQALSTQSAYQSQLDSIKAYQGALNAELGLYQKIGLTNDRTKAIQEELNNLKTEQAEKQPVAFMLTIGNLAMRQARAQFSCNFLASAGYKVIDNLGFATVEEGVEAGLKAGADIIVICSSDDEYAEYAIPAFKALDGRAMFVVAGAPACSEDLKAAGIENFIHVRVNQLETLKEYNAKLGIK